MYPVSEAFLSAVQENTRRYLEVELPILDIVNLDAFREFVMDKHYDRKYQDMHDRLDNLYDKINEYAEKMDNGSIVKQVQFKFPVYYEGEVTDEIRLLNEKTVETVVELVLHLFVLLLQINHPDKETVQAIPLYSFVKWYLLRHT